MIKSKGNKDGWKTQRNFHERSFGAHNTIIYT